VLLLFALSHPLDATTAYGAPTFAPTGIGPSAIAVADCNGDGRPDFAALNGRPRQHRHGVRAVLWPANHKMVDETIDYTATGACGTVSCVIDWEIVDAHHLRLRAERAGSGPGRVYTIHLTSTDTHAHTTSSAVTVIVPHDK